MKAEEDFFIFLLEYYAGDKDVPASEVLEQWDSLGITEQIFEMYQQYHTEDLRNAFEDIDSLIQEKNRTN